jgi:hypothetical protein
MRDEARAIGFLARYPEHLEAAALIHINRESAGGGKIAD